MAGLLKPLTKSYRFSLNKGGIVNVFVLKGALFMERKDMLYCAGSCTCPGCTGPAAYALAIAKYNHMTAKPRLARVLSPAFKNRRSSNPGTPEPGIRLPLLAFERLYTWIGSA